MTRASKALRIVLLLATLLALAPGARGAQRAPAGWRFPTESDYSGGWREFRERMPVPFHFRADFDGDRVTDDAWLLISTDGRSYGLFVFFNRRGGRARVREVFRGSSPVQEVGISVARPGNIRTACGKGYDGACEPGVPKVLRLRRPGIDFFHYEKSNTIYYWDARARRFKYVLISD